MNKRNVGLLIAALLIPGSSLILIAYGIKKFFERRGQSV